MMSLIFQLSPVDCLIITKVISPSTPCYSGIMNTKTKFIEESQNIPDFAEYESIWNAKFEEACQNNTTAILVRPLESHFVMFMKPKADSNTQECHVCARNGNGFCSRTIEIVNGNPAEKYEHYTHIYE